jgi:outer membrane protein TolC
MCNVAMTPNGRAEAMTCDPFLEPGRFVRELGAALLLLIISGLAVAAQTGPPPVSQISGSVPTGTVTPEVRRLTLQDAIEMAVRYNLGAIESGEATHAAKGQRVQALSALLPQVSLAATYNKAQVTAASLGFSSTPILPVPPVIGPFHYSTISVSASQTLFNLESIRRLQAAQTAERAAQLSAADILDLITVAVGNGYLLIIDAASRIDATDAQVRNAQALYDQANEALAAGTSPKIDVTRTSVQLHTEQFNLTVARNNLAIAKLNLARVIGLPLGQAYDVADRLPYVELETRSVDETLQSAMGARADFQAAERAVETAQSQLGAAHAQRYPTVAISGDTGWQGVTLSPSHNIFSVRAGMTMPLFTGGRIEGDVTQAEAALEQRKAERENLRGQIEYDVRTALLNVQAATEQVRVARENLELANDNLARSQERFAAGVTDSVEVVQAQQSLSSANDQYISGTYSHNLAKLQLARAIGVARTNYNQYLQ